MPDPRLSANQQRRVEEIEGFLRTVATVRKLIGDLESNRAARPQILTDISMRISRELFKLRQRAIAANVGTVADVAGNLATLAKRSQGLAMRIRGLNDGVASLRLQLDRAMAIAQTAEDSRKE